MVAANIMSAGVRAIDPDAAVSEALKLFSEGIPGLAAVDKEGSAVGVITPGSIMRAVFKGGGVDGAEACKIMGRVTVKDALEEDFPSVYPDSGIDEVRAVLTHPQNPTGFVMVVDERRRPLGTISPEDLLRRLWRYGKTAR